MTYIREHQLPIAVCETDEFVARAGDTWTPEEHDAFVDFIARHPEAGDIVQGAGGVRKIRWGRIGSGKRGGVRVIYYFHDAKRPHYLITLFAKNEKSDLSPADKKDLSAFAKLVKSRARDEEDWKN